MAQPSFWGQFLAAIRAQESGGNYSEDVAGCLGAYCWNAQSNFDGMAKAAGLGQYAGKNPATLPPQVQDQVAGDNLYRIYQQAGGGTSGLLAAARWWNGGSTSSEANPGLPAQTWAPGCGGGTSAAYACQVLRRMSLGGHFVAGAGSGAGGVVTVAAGAKTDCLIGFGGIAGTSWINDIFGSGGNVGQACFFTKSNARGLVGVTLLVAGGFVMLPGLIMLVMGFPKAARAVNVINQIPAVGPAAGNAAGAAQSAAGSLPWYQRANLAGPAGTVDPIPLPVE